MYSYDFKKRVRYAETDKMGYLYYGNYAKYYEIGRVETMRALGISYKSLEEKHGLMMPVLSLSSRYLAPAHYDELLTIRTSLEKIPDKMIVFNHEILNAEEQIINKAEVKLFFVDMQNGKRVSAPKFIVEKISDKF